MKDVIIFGAGYDGKLAYYKLKEKFHVLCYVDNNPKLHGSQINGVRVFSPLQLREVYQKDMMLVICTSAYLPISLQLANMDIHDYYVMLAGFLYHCNAYESMMPVELTDMAPYRKKGEQESILFVQETACIRTHKIASALKELGYSVHLLYLAASPEMNYSNYLDMYDGLYDFYTQEAVLKFVNQSEFDLIHCSNEPDIMAAVLSISNKTVIHDCHDMGSEYRRMSPLDMVLEYISNKNTDGVIYTTDKIGETAIQKYGLDKENVFILGNFISEALRPVRQYPKLSGSDHQIHCVYEGTVSSNVENNYYFETVWIKLAECGVHVHFYSYCDIGYCKFLETLHERIHYEGNLSSEKLAVEMTKYDVGLYIMNVTERTKHYFETASPNKIWEYINAGIPVVVGEIMSQQKFVEENHFGGYVDINGVDIYAQIEQVAQIIIEDDILHKKKMTMESKMPELVDFYHKCIKKHQERADM